jgi:poly [ADP-ribose] polymerase
MLERKSNLNEKVRKFLEMIWDFRKISKILKELNFDTEKNPLGKLHLE